VRHSTPFVPVKRQWNVESCPRRHGSCARLRINRGRIAGLQDIALAASSRTARAVTEVLVEGRVVLLHSRRGAGVAISKRAVDHIETCLASYNLSSKLAPPLPGKILGAPFNVEDTGWEAVALIEVNMPNPPLTKYRSSQYGMMV